MTISEKVLVRFSGSNGDQPAGNLIADANGDLFGTTGEGGTGYGTVFEVAKTATGYASAPIMLFNFSQTGGEFPFAGLAIDSQGDLFGTTETGGANGGGIIFEIVKTDTGYASTPITLLSFDGKDGKYPESGLTIDANGDLFGTTSKGGAYAFGTVFELAKTANGYASSAANLVNFGQSAGAGTGASLLIDAKGDLIGTTNSGGANNEGKVYEVAKTANGFASGTTTLVSFDFTDGDGALGGVIADSQGNLFGTTEQGGTGAADGTVFEIAKTATGYSSTPITLITFDNTDGALPEGALKMDADGDLFGTTSGGGANGDGTAFELKKTGSGYASAPITLVTFDGKNGKEPQGSLVENSKGNLFGTTFIGGGNGDGAVFEITGSGYATAAAETTASWLSAGANKAAMIFLAPASPAPAAAMAPLSHPANFPVYSEPADRADLAGMERFEDTGRAQILALGFHGSIGSFDLESSHQALSISR